MIEWITLNKEALLAGATTLFVLLGTVVKLTATRKDDTIFNTIVGLIGLSSLTIDVPAPPVVTEPTPEPKPESGPTGPEPKVGPPPSRLPLGFSWSLASSGRWYDSAPRGPSPRKGRDV